MISVESLKLMTQVKSKGTSTEKKLADLLLDENQQVLSTFELNSMASLTYNDETCEQIFNLLEEVLFQPMEFTILCVVKAIVVAKHTLIYGSEKAVSSCFGLGRHIDRLREYNTVIWAQKQQGLGSLWQSIKGGGVDKGFPVRDEAQKLHALIQDQPRVRKLRNDKADPNSLVPVGDDKVGFISDEVRLFMLNRRMEEHKLMRTKSNLVKADGGFGSGFQSKSGQTVIGAAHSLQEMMERASREKKKFSDSGPIHYRAPKLAPEPKPTLVELPPQPPPGPVDLLDFSAPVPAPAPAPATPAAPVDLLDFTAPPAPPPAPAPKSQEPPSLLDFDTPAPAPTPIASIQGPSSDFYNVTTLLDDGKIKQFEDTGDLLEDFPSRNSQGGAGDLLGLGGSAAPAPAQLSIPPPLAASDPFGGIGLTPTEPAAPESVSISITDSAPTATNGLLKQLNKLKNGTVNNYGVSLTMVDSKLEIPPSSSMDNNNHGALFNMNSNSKPSPSVMTTNIDRFSALDDLTQPEYKNSGSILDGLSAENRILGFTTPAPAIDPMPSSMGLSSSLSQPPILSDAPPAPATSGGFLTGAINQMGNGGAGLRSGIGQNENSSAMAQPSMSGLDMIGISALPEPMAPPPSHELSSSIPEPMAPPPSYMIPEPDAEPVSVPVISSSLQAMGITTQYGGDEPDDDDCGFLMGGTTGDGLEPTAPMPAMAPPPPPPMY